MAKESAKTMGLGDVAAAPETIAVGPPQQASSVARAENGRPYCSRHNVLMRATGTKGDVTHYACPVPGCDCKAKSARPKDPIPKEPLTCPQVSCREPAKYLEVDVDRSTLGQLAMVCPGCGFTTRVPRPQIAFVNQRMRESAAEDLSAR